MKSQIISEVVWPIMLIVFLGVCASQLSERLKSRCNDSSEFRKSQFTWVNHAAGLPRRNVRVNALLGGACILLATFWGIDAVLAWAVTYHAPVFSTIQMNVTETHG